MSNTSRQFTARRPLTAVVHTATHTPARLAPHIPAAAARVEALRRLVAAGHYQVNAKLLAQKICEAASVAFEE